MSPTPSTDRRSTIFEVARLAGVSHQTVSRYLRFSGEGLRPATRESVERAIQELNYRPNLVARSMRTRVTGRVAVVMPALIFNPARLLAGVTKAAHQAGYTLEVISPEGGAASRTERILELADTRQVDGILSLAPVSVPHDQLPPDVKIVISEDFDDAMRGIGELADASPVAEMIEQLANWGHRRFYHVAGSDQFASARARTAMFVETIDRLGLHSVGIFQGDWTGESGVSAVQAIQPGKEPTAIIAANDLVAAGVLRAASARGWDVPGEVSVTGWDNDPIVSFLTPSLTTVSVNLECVGQNAMARLIGVLRDEAAGINDEPVNRVVWRESSGPVQGS